MKAFDPALASPFHMEWLTTLDPVMEDDYTRAVAEKAEALLRSARFIEMHHKATGADMEVRVWVEAACGSGAVSVTWEPGVQRFGFHLLDETLRERLACVVFEGVPSVDARESLGQADRVFAAALDALKGLKDAGLDEAAEKVRQARGSVRVPVKEGPETDLGVDP